MTQVTIFAQYLFNIAGKADMTRAGLESIDAERMLDCFQTNTIGPLLTVQQLLENKLLGSGSTIANMTSKVDCAPHVKVCHTSKW